MAFQLKIICNRITIRLAAAQITDGMATLNTPVNIKIKGMTPITAHRIRLII